MQILFSISWRNIWRHPARSGVLIAAIVAGIWAGITISGLTNGIIEQRFNNLIQDDLTHLQVHHPEFLAERESPMILSQADSILSFLESDSLVASAAPRTIVDGMIQSSVTTSGVQVRGIDPGLERQTTTFHENLTSGEYLNSDLRNPLLMGERLAEKLNAEIGERVVLTFQDVNQELVTASFTLSGLFKTASGPFDESTTFARSDDLSELLAGQPVTHEIVVMLQDKAKSTEMANTINHQFEDAEAETWYELSPELRYITDFGGTMTFYVMVVIMLALAFGILNTMLMAIFERMRELGMLMAIGMSKSRIFFMIMIESVILTLSGAAAGIVLAWISITLLHKNGLDLSAVGGDSMAEFGYDSVIYPTVQSGDYIATILLVILTAVLAAVYPALKALRLNPGEVVRE